MEKGHHGLHKLSAAGLLVTLGIIYGDIGTSPLYVLNAIIGRNPIDSDIIQHTAEWIAKIRVSKEAQNALHLFLNRSAG